MRQHGPQGRKPVINLLSVRYFMSKLDKYPADHCYSVACNHCWLNCGRTVPVIRPSDKESYLLEVVALCVKSENLKRYIGLYIA